MKRILLLDQNSQLGNALDHSLSYFGKVIKIDLSIKETYRPGELRNLVTDLRPTLIVNALDWHDIDQVENSQQLAYTFNRDLPAILAETASFQNLPLVHYSTDYVFDGLKGQAYTETDQTNPLSVYGMSKLEGEQAIQSVCTKYLIFRTGTTYDLYGKGFVSNVLRWARYRESLIKHSPTFDTSLVGFSYWASDEETLRVYDDQISSPIWVRTLAELTSLALMKVFTGFDWLSSSSGLYHLACSGAASRLEWAQAILSCYSKTRNIRYSEILPIKTSDFPTPTLQPLYTALNSTRFETTFGLMIPQWQDCLGRAMISYVYREGHKQDKNIVQLADLDAQNIKPNHKLEEKDRKLTELCMSKLWRLGSRLTKLGNRVTPRNDKIVNLIHLSSQILLAQRQGGLRYVLQKTKAHLLKQNDYQNWISNNEPDKKELILQNESSRKWIYRPRVSLILNVHNSTIDVLRATIHSVIQQTYENWELWITNSSVDNGAVQACLDQYSQKDSRIKIIHLGDIENTTTSTNQLIDKSTGELIGFLDEKDLLASFALFEVVKIFLENPHVDIIYSDEDKITTDGRERYAPFFKPAFNPDYLRSINYVSRFLVIARQLGNKVNWFQEDFVDSQNYDLILRVTEKANAIAHCPKILYHQRDTPCSVPSKIYPKIDQSEAGLRALKEHLRRMNIEGSVTKAFLPATYRVSFNFDTTTCVSIIIPNRDHSKDLELCVSSILSKSTYLNYEILIIENGSHEEATFSLYKKLLQYSNIRVIEYHETPFNYSNINNYAATHARGSVLLFLNNDTEVISPNWLECMLEQVCRPSVGVVGAKLYYPDNTIQHAGVVIGLIGIAGHINKHLARESFCRFGRLNLQQNLSAVTAACVMVKRDVFNKVQGFDPNFQLAFGDIDFCLKVRKKDYLVVWTPYAELYHHECKTRGYEDTKEKLLRYNREFSYFRQKWTEVLTTGDEYYNPNLTLDHLDMSIDPKSRFIRPRITTNSQYY